MAPKSMACKTIDPVAGAAMGAGFIARSSCPPPSRTLSIGLFEGSFTKTLEPGACWQSNFAFPRWLKGLRQKVSVQAWFVKNIPQGLKPTLILRCLRHD